MQVPLPTNFNPRSREGSDAQFSGLLEAVGISIHAPVKGATSGLSPYPRIAGISIHAPVTGAPGTPSSG